MLNVVLFEPEIPQNTGNIARTCAIIGAKLHLVKPLGFEISDKYLKRAGLDYWDKLDIEEHESLAQFLEEYPIERNNMYFVTTKGKHCYTEVKYNELNEVFMLFGKETKGLPEDLLKNNLNDALNYIGDSDKIDDRIFAKDFNNITDDDFKMLMSSGYRNASYVKRQIKGYSQIY